MKSSPDFIKVYDVTELLCVVNLNYMFPVLKSDINYLNYANINTYRTFTSIKEQNDYIALLKREMHCMSSMKIEEKAKKLYRIRCAHPESPIAQRCLDFLVLEKACTEYHAAKI